MHAPSSASASADSSTASEATLFGHPRGLFVLFFAELWERFSYYGMRALLTLYMIRYLMYSKEEAGGIYGDYTGLVYLTPLLGGFIADRYLGLRRSIIIGGLLMSLGHGFMAVDDRWLPNQWFMLTGLLCIILGNGMFKPNISTMVGQLYKPGDARRDGGFTIFYMGINIGALLAPLACGWIGQKSWGDVKDGFMGSLAPLVKLVLGVDSLPDDLQLWHLGFGLATVGMLLGLIVFSIGARAYLGKIGIAPSRATATEAAPAEPLTSRELGILGAIVVAGLAYAAWSGYEAIHPKAAESTAEVSVDAAKKEFQNRLNGVLLSPEDRADLPDLFPRSEIVAQATVLEAATHGSDDGKAVDVTLQIDRALKGKPESTFKLSFLETYAHEIKGEPDPLDQSAARTRLAKGSKVLVFVTSPLQGEYRAVTGLGGQGVFTITSHQGKDVYERDAAFVKKDGAMTTEDARGILEAKLGIDGTIERYDKASFDRRLELAVERATRVPPPTLTFIRGMLWPIAGTVVLAIFAFLMMRCRGDEKTRVGSIFTLGIFVMLFWGAFEQAGSSLTIFADENTRLDIFGWKFESSMFQSVNPFCIIAFAPLFSAAWTWLALKGKEPPTPFKMFLGVAFECIAFLILIGPAKVADAGAKVSPVWLTASYAMQTLGELCISPVGLSMVTKLAPARFGAMLMGAWFLANAFANKLAGIGGAKLETMSPFQLFTFITIVLGVGSALLLMVIPVLRKWMAGVR